MIPCFSLFDRDARGKRTPIFARANFHAVKKRKMRTQQEHITQSVQLS